MSEASIEPWTHRNRILVAAGALALLAILGLHLNLYAGRQSQTWDEGDHIYAGYLSWKTADFGLNPEHPPLVKLLATAPLIRMPLRLPELQNRYFKTEAFLGGKEFVFSNDADRILSRARMASSILALLLGLLAFLAAREMFGTGAAFIALTLLAFDPNLLAHGAFVTTDVGLSCFMLASVYAFYRYVKAPSVKHLVVTGLAAGLALATKHTGLLVLPMLALLALIEMTPLAGDAGKNVTGANPGRAKRALRLGAALAIVTLTAVFVLWSFYGFRYAARPDGLELNPPLIEFVRQLPKPAYATVVSALANWRVLPEAYLHGLADVLIMDAFYTSYALGKVYAHGVWFYFPVAFAVKSTLVFLVLPLLIFAAFAAGRLRGRREILFLTVPPALHLIVAMTSRMNIGVRHILPLYVFIAILGAGALSSFVRQDRRWRYPIAFLLLLQAGASVCAFPAYMAYSNALWGGPRQTHRHLTDSNSDWAQQLKSLKRYLDDRDINDCWFAYFAQGTVDMSYYGISCRPLPTPTGFWLDDWIEIPATIDGTVVISAGILSGYEFGPGVLNPYAQFQTLRPSAQIDGGIFVYDGRFDVPLASALTLARRSDQLRRSGQLDEALSRARKAVALAPDDARMQIARGDALAALHREDEARAAYRKALDLAKTIEPEFQARHVPMLKRRLDAPPRRH